VIRGALGPVRKGNRFNDDPHSARGAPHDAWRMRLSPRLPLHRPVTWTAEGRIRRAEGRPEARNGRIDRLLGQGISSPAAHAAVRLARTGRSGRGKSSGQDEGGTD